MCSKCGNRLLSLLLLSPAVCAAVPEIRERFTDLLPGADTTDSVRIINRQSENAVFLKDHCSHGIPIPNCKKEKYMI